MNESNLPSFVKYASLFRAQAYSKPLLELIQEFKELYYLYDFTCLSSTTEKVFKCPLKRYTFKL